MELTVSIKSVYGNDLIYPVCDKAQTFAKMLNKKTLGKFDIANIKRLGYVITVQAPTL